MDSSQPSEAAPDDLPANKAIPGDPGLRASDTDRERAAAVLQAATADGRVTAGELEKRLDLVYSAKSKGELASIVKDLQPMQWADSSPTATKDVGVINSLVRKGRWVVGNKYRATAVISTGVIDLREAQFTGPETTIHVNSWISTVYVIVPENAEVRVSGTGIIGGFKQDRESTGYAATHRINVTGTAVCASVIVVHQLPANKERLLK
nr:AptN [Actinoallomurus sp. ID145808]